MKVYSGFENWPSNIGRTVTSLGNFDGVHTGHQLILKTAVKAAAEAHLPSVVVTFDPVPKKVLNPAKAPALIQTLEQRLHSLEELKIDHTIVVVFNSAFARKSPEEFVQQCLVNQLHVRKFIVGENFAFGHQKSGDVGLLQRLAKQNDFEVVGIPIAQMDGSRVSSTLIRSLVAEGNVAEAHRMLGHPFALIGNVIEGNKLGAKLGIPTANLAAENELLPANGVYVTLTTVLSSSYRSVTNVGVRPTVGGNKLTIEAHLLDFDGDLYGKRMELEFLTKLRDEKKFANVDELKSQIQSDIHQTKLYFQRT